MANNRKKDPYRKLTIVMIVLLVLLVLLGTGYVLLDSYQKGQQANLQKKVEEENAKLVQEYQVALKEQQDKLSQKEVKEMPQPAATGWDIVDVSAFPVEGGQSVTTSRLDALQGGLMLLNRWHELPADFAMAEETLKSLGEETGFRVPVRDRNVKLFPSAISALDKLVADAKEEGLEFYIVRTGYRTMADQTEIWNKELSAHPNRSGEGLVEAARVKVAYPGTSDFQSGFSFEVDIYSREDSVITATPFQTSEQAKFLNENGWKYGIVFRYPSQGYPYANTEDKSYITGISSSLKLDAYRYVGIPHAAVMHIKGFCLEEYIDYLVANPHIIVYEDGVAKYEIYRVPEGLEDRTHDIPANATDFFVSTDNMGGLVCAITY